MIAPVPDIALRRATGREANLVDADERFNALYRAHYPAVLRYASRRADPDTARDVVADTFLVAWRKLKIIPADPEQVEPWLYGVARRMLANSDRSRRRTQRLTDRLSHQNPDMQQPDLAVAVTERERLAQALARLSEADQEALRLIGWEELDLAAAAIAMGCSRSVMAVRLHRARRRLEQILIAAELTNESRVSGHSHVVRQENR
jgi:RNA polymerase sigma-70 factor, ECF subfamily